jgi:hypothetical protein
MPFGLSGDISDFSVAVGTIFYYYATHRASPERIGDMPPEYPD